jgi:hypothetical protein
METRQGANRKSEVFMNNQGQKSERQRDLEFFIQIVEETIIETIQSGHSTRDLLEYRRCLVYELAYEAARTRAGQRVVGARTVFGCDDGGGE